MYTKYWSNACHLAAPFFAELFEPQHDKVNKLTCASNKDQISLGILPDWSVFAIRIKKPWVLNYP